jgi:biotin transport system ATP-binding protein
MITVTNLSQRFPDNTLALDGIDFTIHKGEFIVLAGENGSGKTVLVKHFNGLLKPTTGQVLFNGKPVLQHLREVRQGIGFVFQNSNSQILGQTVGDDVAFGPRNLGFSREEIEQNVSHALAEVGLTEKKDRLPATLSGGEKRRLALAGVLSMNPEIIIFDEPFIHLDYHGVQQTLSHIVTLHKQGKTIILITHDLEKVLAHASRLMIMYKGHIVLDGSPGEVIKETGKYNIRIPYGNNRPLSSMTWLTI